MPVFHYKAYKAGGDLVVGELSAKTHAAARDMLAQTGLMPVTLRPRTGGLWARLNEPVTWRKTLSLDGRVTFFKSLERLLSAGLPLDKALTLALDMGYGKAEAQKLTGILPLVRQGKSLSAAMASIPRAFETLEIEQVRVGEQTGRLAHNIRNLAHGMARRQAFQNKIKGALLYPALLLVVVILTIIMLSVLVLPRFAPLFAGHEDKLPFLTKAVLFAGQGIAGYGLVLLGSLMLLASLGRYWFNQPANRLRTHTWLAARAAWKGSLGIAEAARFAGTTGLAITGGIGIDRALGLASTGAHNQALAAQIEAMRVKIRQGQSLTQCLCQDTGWPSVLRQFVIVGEQTGRLGEMLDEAAAVLEQIYEERLDRMMTLFTPALTLVAGGMVALMVGAIVMGMMTINDLAF